MKRNGLTLLCIMLLSLVVHTSGAKTPIKLVQGNPLILLKQGKKAVYEIDYSQMIVTNSKNPENDADFYTWMEMQDEDNGKWIKDWEQKDKKDCDKTFREKFNDEVEKGLKLTKFGQDYRVTFRLFKIDFGPPVKYSFRGLSGGEAIADGEFEVRDFNTDELVLLLEFKQLKGEDSFKQIGRLKGVFENFGEELWQYLNDYKKAEKKAAKNKKK